MSWDKLVHRLQSRIRQWREARLSYPDQPSGWKDMTAVYDKETLHVGGHEVMREWERPLMRALAREATAAHGHVLEVGFGMAISATYIMEFGCSRYTVIEPHPAVLARAREWAANQPAEVEIVEGLWQDVMDRLGKFDAILFDTFPLNKSEEGLNLFPPFVPVAREHLNPGGVFTFYSGRAETLDSVSLKLLLATFDEVRLYKLGGLQPPRGSPFWESGSMVVPVCTVR
jgi:guanidinoacetate N-methyltransferase